MKRGTAILARMGARSCLFALVIACGCGSPAATSTTPPPATAPAIASASAAPAPSARTAIAKDLPVVAIVRADWCPSCRAVEPKLALIEKEYAGRIAFVRLNVTDDDTTAGAADDADAAGVRSFFDQTKGRTASIGVFSKDRKELFRTWGLKNEAELRQALDAAAKP